MLPSSAIPLFALLMSLAALSPSVGASDAPLKYSGDTVNEASRPDADKARDADRKPAEMIAFAGIKPGNKVADLLPGGGYFTRLFAEAVGPRGHVYAFVPEELLKLSTIAGDAVKALITEPKYSNVSLIVCPVSAFKAPEALDLVWTSQNYHDLHSQSLGADIAAFNKAVFEALKPGGAFVVLDHVASANSSANVTATLHRIDPEVVKKEVLAAGFELDGQSDVLKNSTDDHIAPVFDASIRGKTDQFVLKFRKPK